jgi:hypothetical protein
VSSAATSVKLSIRTASSGSSCRPIFCSIANTRRRCARLSQLPKISDQTRVDGPIPVIGDNPM